MLRLLILLLFFFSLSAKGQTDRPKIGLVLSGGSAHGLAHIGALKYLEEQGIQVDYITGTSMGAVIGGLYAMGNSADDIYEIAASLDWELIMSNHSPLNEVSPAEKEYHEKIPLSLLWNESSFKFPQGLIRGQKLDLLISNTFSPAYYVYDFDKLPIPFRCVAVDLEEGNIRVFDSGYLGEAVRASMAIPSVFPPKEIDDRLYVDGGLIRNFPVQENIKLGSDIIIGVYVGSKKVKRDKLNSLFDILRQSASMAALLDSEHQSNLLDILIEPEVKEMGSFDFANYKKFIQLGYDAAELQGEAIKSLADSLSKFEKPIRIAKLDHPVSITVPQIKTSEQNPLFKKMILNKLKFKENEQTSLSEIEESISLVYGTKNFSKASYSFYQLANGYGIEIDTKEVNPYSIGLSINRFKYYNTSFIISGVARNVFGKPSRARIDVRLSENPGLQVDYLLRIPKKPSYYLKAGLSVDRHELPFYNGPTVDRLYRTTNWKGGISINKEWRNSYLFSLGYQFNFDSFVPKVFNSIDIKQYRTAQDEVFLNLEYNNLDRSVFPDKGIQSSLHLSGILNNRLKRTNQSSDTDFFPFVEDRNFFLADFKFAGFIHAKGILCHEFYIKARFSTGDSFTRSYKIGGPMQETDVIYGFLGVDDSELIIGDHVSVKYGLRLHLNSSIYFTPTVQYLYGDNYLSYAFNEDETISIYSYGLIFGIDSPLGPLALDFGLSSKTERLVLNFGIGFRHIL